MTQQAVVELFRGALMAAFWLSLPVLGAGFVAGILISLVQIVTSMQDSAFATVPRLAAFLAALLIFLPWMLIRLVSYTTLIWGDFGRYAR
jgi:flagellar biosynthesis protein FliQ